MLGPLAIGLAYTAPLITPRLELRERVLGAIGSQPQSIAAPARFAPKRPGRSWTSGTWLPYAAMLIVAVGLGGYASRLQARVTDLESRLAQATTTMLATNRALDAAQRVADNAQSAMAVLAAADLQQIDLAGQTAAPSAMARALWSRQRGLVFTATNLPPLPEGRTYQLWVVTAQMPVSAGIFAPDTSGRGIGVFTTSPDIGAPKAFAVTVEPAGGVPAPTNTNFYLLGAPAPQL